MNRRELLKAIPGMYVNGRLASKVADALSAKRALIRGPGQPGKEIAEQLVMHRTYLLELITAIRVAGSAGPAQDLWVAEQKARDFIYLVVQPILDPKCPNCHKLWEDHAEYGACFNALREVPVTSPRVAIR